jgi:hypothetical protein
MSANGADLTRADLTGTELFGLTSLTIAGFGLAHRADLRVRGLP